MNAKQLLSSWILIIQSKNLRKLLQIYLTKIIRLFLDKFFFSF